MLRAPSAARSLCIVALLLALPAAARGDSAHDPALRFHTFRTTHFVIYFHDREDALAARLGPIAEDTWQQLAARLGPAPPPLTHVVLVDETELANGSAFPLPYNTVVITAAWPAGTEYIGNTDDWLRLVFTHEFTHIVHLDRSGSWARIVRAIFGRVPLAFPNLFLPGWQIEGLATFEESAITGHGRLHAGDFQQIVDAAVRAHAPEPLDRTNGGLTDWPGGLAVYAYGLGFHEYLAQRFGEAKFRELADRTSRRVPYTASRVFRSVYGESLGDLWRDYERSLEDARRSEPAAATGTRQLTHHGFYVTGPRFTDEGIVYSVRTPHDFPSLNRIPAGGGRSQRLTTRFLGSTSAPGEGVIYFDQQELRRNAGLYSDLYAMDLRSGHVRQLTYDARLIDPDLAPGGHTLVAVQNAAGRRNLVTIGLNADGTTGRIDVIASAPETQFNAPRWSPDGRQIAVERHRHGSLSEVVIFDAASHAVTAVVARAKTRIVTPAWTRTGRAVLVAAAPEDATFQLFEVTPGTPGWRQITDVAGGAIWPDLSPDGRTIVYAGYTVDGYDVFTMPYKQGLGIRDSGLEQPGQPTDDSPIPNPQSPIISPYSPWPTLFPTSWTPALSGDRHSLHAGVATGGFDVLGYHAWAVSATWLLTSPAGAPLPSRATPDWQVAYAYARWRPTFYVSASSDTSFFAGPPTDSGTPSEVTLREREVQAGVLLPIRHVRVAHTALAAFVDASDEFTFVDGTSSLTRAALRAGWTTTTAHVYGYSISPEGGITVGGTVERVDPGLGASAEADAATGDLRVYAPGFGRHHVTALRLAGGTSSGDPALRRTFHLGGAGPDADLLDFGANAISLLRGFPIDTFAGRNVVLLNADYRFPLARIERGAGTWPLFIHTIHAAVFADAGHAWTRTFRARDAKTSVGGELSFDVVAGYSLPFTATTGIAYGRDGSGHVANGVTLYARIGHAF